jgi:hypothetical protein
VTGLFVTERAQSLEQVERLVSSHTLHGSESLCKLLRYLTKHALDHPGAPLKEYQIATEVFGRQSDFDPQVDSMVRVQAGRLRTKLAEYYSSEGGADPVWVELPKGTYVLSFHHGPPHSPRVPSSESHDPRHDLRHEATPLFPIPRKWIFAVVTLSFLLVATAAALAFLLAARNTAQAGPVGVLPPAPAAVHIFWKGFVSGPEEPWVIFSNAAFTGRPDTGMRYYDSKRDSKTQILDHYTGVGEVLAVHELDTVFSQLRQTIRVKRGSLFSLDDAKNNDLIFIGSPSENLSLLDIPGTQEFVFKQVPSGPRAGNMEIVNVHPQPDEPREVLATPATQPLTEDYAIIALVKGLNPTRSVLILAGTTTMGTQAAVESVCRENSLEQLLLRLAVTRSGELGPFEALLHVKVARGVPVSSELIALRKRTP